MELHTTLLILVFCENVLKIATTKSRLWTAFLINYYYPNIFIAQDLYKNTKTKLHT